MIRARFIYTDCLYGEWTTALPGGPMMVPNPKYAHRLMGVEFETWQSEGPPPPKPRPHSGRAYRTGVIANGRTA